MNPRPTFLVIGAARAGTTALHHWLGQHPDVCVSRPKETQFFSLHHERGLTYYEDFFAHHRGEPVVGETTPVYLTLPYVPARIGATLPAAALIAILRDPVEQAYSTWWKLRCLGVERRSFEDAVQDERDADPWDDREAERDWSRILMASERGRPVDRARYLVTGHYVEAIERYHRHIEPARLTILLHDDLVRDPVATTRRIAAAVGVEHSRAPAAVPPRVNQAQGRVGAWVQRRVRSLPSARFRRALATGAGLLDRRDRPPLADETRRDLVTYFAEVNRGLDELVDADTTRWFVERRAEA